MLLEISTGTKRPRVKCTLSRCIRHKNLERSRREKRSEKKCRLGSSSSESPASTFFPRHKHSILKSSWHGRALTFYPIVFAYMDPYNFLDAVDWKILRIKLFSSIIVFLAFFFVIVYNILYFHC